MMIMNDNEDEPEKARKGPESLPKLELIIPSLFPHYFSILLAVLDILRELRKAFHVSFY